MKNLIYVLFTMASLLIEAIIPTDASMKISENVKKRCDPTAIVASFKGNINLITDKTNKQKISKGQSLCGSDQLEILSGANIVIKCTSDQKEQPFKGKLYLDVNNICGKYLTCYKDGNCTRSSDKIVFFSNDEPNIITPRGNILPGQKIIFQWDEVEGINNYTVSIYKANKNIFPPREVTQNKYEFSEQNSGLKPEIKYKLIITSGRGGKEAKSEFKILNEDQAKEIQRQIDQQQDVMGKVLIYKQNNLFSDAIQLLEKQENKSYEIYKHLATCYETIGRIDKAKVNYEAALKVADTLEQKKFLEKEIQKLQKLIDKNKKARS